jgi:hypothetical protein
MTDAWNTVAELTKAEAEAIAQRLVADLLALDVARASREGVIECRNEDGQVELIEWTVDYTIVKRGVVAGRA